MYKIGTKVTAPNGSIGVIKEAQEKNWPFAQGYFVFFEDINITLFMADGTVKPYEEILEYKIIVENGQYKLDI